MSESKEMTFWEHLDELRKVLFNSAILIVVLMCAVFPTKEFLFDKIIFAPLSSDFPFYGFLNGILALLHASPLPPFKVNLININLSAQFFIHMSTSFYVALLLGTPYVLYQLWTFVRPALYENEKKAVRKTFGFASFLFYIGVLFSYYVIFPLTLRFLGTYSVSSLVPNEFSFDSYMSMFIWMNLIMGVVFELPVVAALLSRMKILSKSLLKKYRKHAFVVMMIIAAFITPTGDPFTLSAVGLPLYMLYEVSILVCRDFN
ncbi:MAG: twin-arginine translocase subunit TatC [Bacteroidales bacterium]|nr:twin-arginine translocase subunit TatC [Bacteroidales bacterium]